MNQAKLKLFRALSGLSGQCEVAKRNIDEGRDAMLVSDLWEIGRQVKRVLLIGCAIDGGAELLEQVRAEIGDRE